MVLKGKKYQTFHGFTNKFSYRGTTLMFVLSKSGSQLYLAIYGGNYKNQFIDECNISPRNLRYRKYIDIVRYRKT